MYQALYRKWRPQTFDQVVGQEHITEILKKQVLTDRPSHAYLFTGTRGTGKTTCAKLLAKAVNCLNPVGGSPCNQCEICRGIESGAVLDVTEMDAASNNGVDDVRALRDEAVYAPVAARRRVYIIDEVHMLSKPAFNALLKIMEEPPEHLIFILATTELYKVPATILSRCQRYAFRRVPAALIQARLEQVAKAEALELTDEAAALLSRLADGGMRDALSLLDQCAGARVDRERVLSAIGLAENEEICRLLSALLRGDADTALSILDSLYRGGKEVGSVLSQLAALYRDILLGRLAPQNGGSLMSGGFSEAALRQLSGLAGVDRLLSGLDTVQAAAAGLDRAVDRKLAAELCLIRLAGLSPAPLGDTAPVPPSVSAPAPAPISAPVPAAASAPIMTPEPTTKPESTPIPAPIPTPAALTWKALLDKMNETMFIADYIMLSDAANLTGKVEGGVVTLYTKNDTVKALLEAGKLEEVKAAAAALAGAAVPVKVEPYRESGGEKLSKLDQLLDQFK